MGSLYKNRRPAALTDSPFFDKIRILLPHSGDLFVCLETKGGAHSSAGRAVGS